MPYKSHVRCIKMNHKELHFSPLMKVICNIRNYNNIKHSIKMIKQKTFIGSFQKMLGSINTIQHSFI